MKKLATLFLTALLLSAMFHQDLLTKHILTPENRVTAPLQSSSVQLGDHYYYYILSKKSYERLLVNLNLRDDDTFQSQNSGLENVFAGALLTAGSVDTIAKLLPLPWNIEVTISLVLQTSLLFSFLLLLYKSVNSHRLVPVFELFIFGFVWAIASYGVIRGIYIGRISYIFTSNPFPGYPDFLRTVNPQLGWAAGVLYLSVLYKYYSTDKASSYPLCIGMSLIISYFSVSIAATMLLGLGLFGLIRLWQTKKLDHQLLIIGLCLFFSFCSVYYLMSEFRATEKGLSLNTGSFNELSLRWHFLYLAAFLPLIYLLFDLKTKWLMISLFTSAFLVGFVCDSVELGSRIWLRGAGFITLSILLLTVFKLFLLLIKAIHLNTGNQKRIAVALTSLGCVYLIYWLAPIDEKDWHYNMSQTKADVITWITNNTEPKSLIASEDLQDAYYLPIYTSATPFVQLYDYSTYDHETLLTNYLLVMKALGKEPTLIEQIGSFDLNKRREHLKYVLSSNDQPQDYVAYQTYAFYAGLLYYPYTSEFKQIFSTNEEKAQFVDEINTKMQQLDVAQLQQVNYLIKVKSEKRVSIEGFETVYSNRDFEILQNTRK